MAVEKYSKSNQLGHQHCYTMKIEKYKMEKKEDY